MLTIDLPTARCFILSKQGLWPGDVRHRVVSGGPKLEPRRPTLVATDRLRREIGAILARSDAACLVSG